MFAHKEQIYEIYKERSFSKAAQNLYISQPSLSNMVKRTEDKLGCAIFDRSTSPIQVTELGKKYIYTIELIMELERDFAGYMEDLKGFKTGNLSLGGSNLFSSYILPPLISRFMAQYPGIKVQITEDKTSHLIEQLSMGNLDFIVDNSYLDPAVFEKCLYCSEHLLLAVPKHFSVNLRLKKWQLNPADILSCNYLDEKIPAVSLQEFADEPFVFLKPENDTTKRAEKLCHNSGFNPKVLFRLDQQVTAYNVASSGMGICFISDTLIRCRNSHPDMVYYKLSGSLAERNIYFYYKRGKYLTFAMNEFLKTLNSDEN